MNNLRPMTIRDLRRRIPNNIVREDFGEKIDLLDAEKLAAD